MDERKDLSLRGPIEWIDAQLVLRIPLTQVEKNSPLFLTESSEVVGNDLVVMIPDWLAEKLGVSEGSGL